METMLDKGISQIAYNFLNLPNQIVQNGNITTNLYRADGVKLKKTYNLVNTTSSMINTEYLDGFQYSTPNIEPIRRALQVQDDATVSATTAGNEEAFLPLEDREVVALVPGNPTEPALILSFFPTAEGYYDYENFRYIYQYKDHLGNVRVSFVQEGTELKITDSNDYYPFGLSFLKPTGNISVYDPMAIPYNYKYNGKELQETGMYDYGARFYMPDIGRWGVVDPLAEKMPSWSPYNYTFNNPINFTDPTGMAPEGDYYTKLGRYLGSDGKNDNKVYVADSKTITKNDNGTTSTSFNNAKELSISHSEFQKQAATVYGESSAYKSGVTTELAQEMGAIANVHQSNKIAYGATSAQAKLFKNASLDKRTGKMQLANWAVINAVDGGYNYSNGANMWDGAEQSMFPATDTRASNGRFELHMNTMGWKISDAHYEKWKSNVGSSFQAPQIRVSPQNYPEKRYYNGGKIRLESTAVYGGTIFWRSN